MIIWFVHQGIIILYVLNNIYKSRFCINIIFCFNVQSKFYSINQYTSILFPTQNIGVQFIWIFIQKPVCILLFLTIIPLNRYYNSVYLIFIWFYYNHPRLGMISQLPSSAKYDQTYYGYNSMTTEQWSVVFVCIKSFGMSKHLLTWL